MKRGEIVPPKYMNQEEYSLYLYRWLKKSFPSWEQSEGYVELKTVSKALDSNEMIADHFSIDLLALLKDMEVNDEKEAESLEYISISQKAYTRYQSQLEGIFPEKTDKRQEEMFKASVADMLKSRTGNMKPKNKNKNKNKNKAGKGRKKKPAAAKIEAKEEGKQRGTN